MQIEYLREFLILEKTCNFSEAAKLLHISQSSLSKHIAALEDEVDVDLFKRLGNTLQLTEAGSVFLDGALILVNDHNSFVERMKAIKARNDAVLDLVSAGRGIAIAGDHNRQSHPHLLFKPFADLSEPLTIPVSLIWRTELEKYRSTSKHIAMLKKAVADISRLPQVREAALSHRIDS